MRKINTSQINANINLHFHVRAKSHIPTYRMYLIYVFKYDKL